jgi:hypothetical protein
MSTVSFLATYKPTSLPRGTLTPDTARRKMSKAVSQVSKTVIKCIRNTYNYITVYELRLKYDKMDIKRMRLIGSLGIISTGQLQHAFHRYKSALRTTTVPGHLTTRFN